MVTITPLRHVRIGGSFFTENFILKLRNNPDSYKETHWNNFAPDKKQFEKELSNVWEWVKLQYDPISSQIDSWDENERYSKWIEPLLVKLGHKPEKIIRKSGIGFKGLKIEDYIEETDDILSNLRITHQMVDEIDPILHIVKDEDLEERIIGNYQNKSHHDLLQLYILINQKNKWGILSNGKKFRLLGEYSNVYSKGYIEFDLENIILNRDDKEFRLFYSFIHFTRFIRTFGLDINKWRESIKKILAEVKFDNKDILIIKLEESINYLITKANKFGVDSVTFSDSEEFIELIKKANPEQRSSIIKEIEEIISSINNNRSILQILVKTSQDFGVEVGKGLRNNVQQALEIMGQGFIDSNPDFSSMIVNGKIDIYEYYQELLRIAYRLIFILYLESKNIMPGITSLYYHELSISSLRIIAEKPIRESSNNDLWYKLLLLFNLLDIGNKELGINAFNGHFFSINSILLIKDNKLYLSNSLVLKVIKSMTVIETSEGLQRVNYSEINEEEIGGIYESLLDYQPRYLKNGNNYYKFKLDPTVAERKGTGSYYTPKGAIDIILKTTLDPILNKIKDSSDTKDQKLKKLKNLKICDPACGGGSFLLAVLDYMGIIYAQLEMTEKYPSEERLRSARREILQNCIYGVDLNPLAIELAKMSLWLKAIVNDKPLTFLDNHLKVGNSLIGFVKKHDLMLIKKDFFNIIKGDKETGVPDESVAQMELARKTLGKIDEKQTFLDQYIKNNQVENFANEIFYLPENTVYEYKIKEDSYQKLHEKKEWRKNIFQDNAWTTSFFWSFNDNNIQPPNNGMILRLEKYLEDSSSQILAEIDNLAKEYNIFNWYLEFPEVFQINNSGFDCILMNPPWDVLSFQDLEFFAGKNDSIIKAKNKSERITEIKNLKVNDHGLYNKYVKEFRKIRKFSHFCKTSGFYDLSSVGKINLFALFLERSINLVNNDGRVGAIFPSTFFTGNNLSKLFEFLIEKNYLGHLLDFHNRLGVFPIGNQFHFCLVELNLSPINQSNIKACFSAWDFIKVSENLLGNKDVDTSIKTIKNIDEGGRIIELNQEDFYLFNPNTRNCPIFRHPVDYILVRKAYQKAQILIKYDKKGNIIEDSWGIYFHVSFNMSSDSDLFITKDKLDKIGAQPLLDDAPGGIWIIKNTEKNESEEYYPLYEGSDIWYYDYRLNKSEFKSDTGLKKKKDLEKTTNEEKSNPNYEPEKLYWIKKQLALDKLPKEWDKNWFIAFRDVTGPHNMRSFVVSVIPKFPVGHKLPVIAFKVFRKQIICFLANASSLIMDYIARTKIAGTSMSFYVVEQLPFFRPDHYTEYVFNLIKDRVIELIYTSHRMHDFAKDFGYDKTSPYLWNEERRLNLKAEIDAIFAILYGYSYEEFDYILETFWHLKKVEQTTFGEYKTKKLALNAYNIFINDKNIK